MPVVTYSHKRPPVPYGSLWDCCPHIVFPQGIPNTVADPIDEDGFSMIVWAVPGADPIVDRLHPKLAERIAEAAQSRGFNDVTAADVQRT